MGRHQRPPRSAARRLRDDRFQGSQISLQRIVDDDHRFSLYRNCTNAPFKSTTLFAKGIRKSFLFPDIRTVLNF